MKVVAPAFLLLFALACSPILPVAPNSMPVTRHQDPDTHALRAGWQVDTSMNKMDQAPEVILSKAGVDGGRLIVRCSHGRTEVYVATGQIVSNGRVRIKFDNDLPHWRSWNEAESDDALFVPNPIEFARKLSATEKFLFEYQPFEKTRTTLEFDVSGVGQHLGLVAQSCNWAKFDQAREDARAAAKRGRLRDARIREALAKYVGPCREEWLRAKGRWCWYDQNDSYFKNGGSPKETREAALSDAIFMAKSGRVFAQEIERIDRELK